jgi:hypothetical protein
MPPYPAVIRPVHISHTIYLLSCSYFLHNQPVYCIRLTCSDVTHSAGKRFTCMQLVQKLCTNNDTVHACMRCAAMQVLCGLIKLTKAHTHFGLLQPCHRPAYMYSSHMAHILIKFQQALPQINFDSLRSYTRQWLPRVSFYNMRQWMSHLSQDMMQWMHHFIHMCASTQQKLW